MRTLHQIVGALHAGDAVGHEVLAVQALLRAAGLESEVFAGRVDAALVGRARPLRERPQAAACLYHFAPGSPATDAALRSSGPLALLYHNVTPAALLAPWESEAARLSARAERELKMLATRAALALAHSEFSRGDLVAAGFSRSSVLPFALDLEAAARPASPVLAKMWDDGRSTFLAVGRIAPNKRVEDVIRAFGAFLRRHARQSRLLLVGEADSFPRYAAAVRRLATALGAQVIFAGRVPARELRSAYAAADALLSLSVHEGYGVPLVEAMLQGVPVIALDAGAARETLRGGGVLARTAEPAAIAELMAAVRRGGPLREAVLDTQRRAVAAIRGEDFAARLLAALEPLLAEAT